MLTGRINFLLRFFLTTLISFSFIGGDCSTNDDGLPPVNSVAAPGSFSFKVEAVAGGDSKVIFNWTASADENEADFRGYRIKTVELNNNNQTIFTLQEQSFGKTIKSHNINLERGKRYKTFLVAELTDGTKSDTLGTDIYAGVFYNTDGVIDSYVNNSSSMSGFGWNFITGVGTQYPYTQSNDDNIDIHIRELGSDPYFFSPGGLDEGFKLTRIKNIGSGQSAFDETDLPEPDETFLVVNLGDVYLVKTEEGFYAKVWIKSITPPSAIQNYYIITFEYKLQPIQNLRIL